MNKLIIIIALGIILPLSSFSQEIIQIESPSKFLLIAKGGVGTSWLKFPKAFLVDENDLDNVWSIAPSTNGFTGYLGVEGVVSLGKNWIFLSEINFSYSSGKVQINQLQESNLSRKWQTYVRLNIPLHFGLISSDNFWFAFGPTVYFTLNDNKGFDEAVLELAPDANVNSDIPVGVAASIVAAWEINEKMYLDFRFDFDQFGHFKYKDGTYDVRPEMQSITVGLGYLLNQN